MSSLFISLGGMLAAVAVALGALGAHALKSHLTSAQLEVFHTAVQYQMLHAVGLIVVGLLAQRPPRAWLAWAGGLLLAGIALFSGCLYLWIFTGQRALMFLVPVGGTSFIVGWLLVAAYGIAALRRRRS